MIKITVYIPCEIQAESIKEVKDIWRSLKNGAGVSQSDGINSYNVRADKVTWNQVQNAMQPWDYVKSRNV